MNPYLKNILILLVVIYAFAILLANNFSNEGTVSSDKSVIKIDSNVSSYLKNESEYKRFLSGNKNVVFYGEECSCPYSQRFVSEMKALRKTGRYRDNYSFVIIPNDLSVITMKDKDYENLKVMKAENPSLYESYIEQGMAPIEKMMPESKGKLLNEFYRKCEVFCIVNSTTDKMVRFNGVGNKEIEQLENILEKYNNLEW